MFGRHRTTLHSYGAPLRAPAPEALRSQHRGLVEWNPPGLFHVQLRQMTNLSGTLGGTRIWLPRQSHTCLRWREVRAFPTSLARASHPRASGNRTCAEMFGQVAAKLPLTSPRP